MKHRPRAHGFSAVARTTAIATATAVLLAGCAAGAAPEPAEEVPTTPQALSIATVAPGTSTPEIVLGVAEGIYEKHMIDLTETNAQSGIVNLLIGGEVDTVATAWVPIIIAASQGAPITTVSTAGSFVDSGLHGLFVRANAGIASGADLEGKTVAVNALGSLGELAFRELIEQDGGDPKDVQVTELAFPDMISSLALGNVDAAWLPGPFFMAGMANAELALLSDFADIDSINGLPNVGFVGMVPWVEQNRGLVKRFNDAVAESIAFVNANEDRVRTMQVEVGGLPEQLAAVIALEPHVPDLPRGDVQRLVDLMLKWGLIDKAPDMDVLYPAS